MWSPKWLRLQSFSESLNLQKNFLMTVRPERLVYKMLLMVSTLYSHRRDNEKCLKIAQQHGLCPQYWLSCLSIKMQTLLSLWAMKVHRAQWVCVFHFCLASGVRLIGVYLKFIIRIVGKEMSLLLKNMLELWGKVQPSQTQSYWVPSVTKQAWTRLSSAKIVIPVISAFCLYFSWILMAGGSIKKSLTPRIFISFTEGAKWSFFLCRYEKDMVLLLVRFALWEEPK